MITAGTMDPVTRTAADMFVLMQGVRCLDNADLRDITEVVRAVLNTPAATEHGRAFMRSFLAFLEGEIAYRMSVSN